MDPLIGRSFGAYKILESVGEGGMAVVYKGFQESLNRYVAIKVLRGDLAQNQEFIARFRREALAVAALSHPNLLHVYDAGRDHGVYYIIMDYVPGGSLHDLIGFGPVEPGRAVSIAAQVADALDSAHRRGLIHRDVKPSNILMAEDGRPLLTDFGIAKALHESTQLTHTGASIGTPAYMAPEQAEGQSTDGRTDIYALGIVLFEMLSGQAPFRAETPMELIYKQMQTPPPPLRQVNPSVPAGLEGIVNRALAKQPKDRYQTAGEFAAALRQFQTSEAPSAAARARVKQATPTPTPAGVALLGPEGQRRRRRLLAILVMAIVAVLLALLGTGAYLLLGGGGPTGTAKTPLFVTMVVTSRVVTVVVSPEGAISPATEGSTKEAALMPTPVPATLPSPPPELATPSHSTEPVAIALPTSLPSPSPTQAPLVSPVPTLRRPQPSSGAIPRGAGLIRLTAAELSEDDLFTIGRAKHSPDEERIAFNRVGSESRVYHAEL